MSDPNLPTPEVDQPQLQESGLSGIGIVFNLVERLRRRLYEILGMFELRLRKLERGMYIPKPLKKFTELTNALVTYYTVPTIQEPRKALVEVTSVIAMNYSANIAYITMHVIASGGSAGNSNMFLDAVPCYPGETTIVSDVAGLFTMESGDFIQAKADVNNAIVISINGRERQ